MPRAFDLLEQLTDVLVVEPGAELQRARLDDEGRAPLEVPPQRESQPQGLVDDLLERGASAAGLGFELRRHVIIESESRAHIMMLIK